MLNSCQVFEYSRRYIHNQLLQFMLRVCPISLSMRKKVLTQFSNVYACVKNKVIGQNRVGMRIGCRQLWVFNINISEVL